MQEQLSELRGAQGKYIRMHVNVAESLVCSDKDQIILHSDNTVLLNIEYLLYYSVYFVIL